MIIDAKIHFVYFDCSLTHIQQINVDLNLIKIFINHTQPKHKKTLSRNWLYRVAKLNGEAYIFACNKQTHL